VIGQVVQRPEKENGIDAGVRQLEGTGVANVGTCKRYSESITSGGSCLLDVQWNWFYQVNAIAAFCQPHGVSPGAATDIGDHGRRRREMSPDDHLGARELERAGAAVKAIAFMPPCIEGRNVLGIARRVVH
jgi:hypothetical protein